MFQGPDDFDEQRGRYWLNELVSFVGGFAVLILLAAIIGAAGKLKPPDRAHNAQESKPQASAASANVMSRKLLSSP